MMPALALLLAAFAPGALRRRAQLAVAWRSCHHLRQRSGSCAGPRIAGGLVRSDSISMKHLCVVLWILVLAGCGASTMPPALTAEQLKAIDNRRYDCVLGIERYKWPVCSESLDKAIRNTGLFKDVVWSDSGRKYDVVARVEETVHGTATIPLVAILTLGILPSVVEEDHGHVFSLQAVDGQSERIAISTIYTGNTV